MLKSKERLRALGASALIALVLMLFFSSCSPLYPTNPWGEANAFFTMGRGVLAGKVPYRDLALKVGPVMVALHALAACISSTGFVGVWLLEIVAMTGTLYFAWKIAVKNSGRSALAMVCVALMGVLLVSGKAFVFGDTVEEFALPMQLWTLCDLLDYLQDDRRRMPAGHMLLHGVLAGCVFWLKYWLIGVHVVFIAVIAIDAMVRERGVGRSMKMCLEYLAGMMIATLPWLIYFGANGATIDLLDVYFCESWENLARDTQMLRYALMGLASGVKNNPIAALAILCGAGYLLRRLAQRKWKATYTAICAAFACMVLIVYAKGERYRFLPLAMGAFLMLCAEPMMFLVQYAWRKKKAYACLLTGAAAICAGYSCWSNDNLPFIGYPESELPQTKFAQIIAENGGGSILTYHIADNGFYLAADQIPQFKSFARSDAYFTFYDEDAMVVKEQKRLDALEAEDALISQEYQDRYLKEGRVEWVVSRRSDLYYEYECVAEASSPYARSTQAEKGAYQYYLYRLMEYPNEAQKEEEQTADASEAMEKDISYFDVK